MVITILQVHESVFVESSRNVALLITKNVPCFISVTQSRSIIFLSSPFHLNSFGFFFFVFFFASCNVPVPRKESCPATVTVINIIVIWYTF